MARAWTRARTGTSGDVGSASGDAGSASGRAGWGPPVAASARALTGETAGDENPAEPPAPAPLTAACCEVAENLVAIYTATQPSAQRAEWQARLDRTP